MNTVEGYIENKEVTIKTDWTRCVFTVKGMNYSTFDEKIISTFNKGDHVIMALKEVNKNGKTYMNLVDMKIQPTDDKQLSDVKPEVVAMNKQNNIANIAGVSAADYARAIQAGEDASKSLEEMMRILNGTN